MGSSKNIFSHSSYYQKIMFAQFYISIVVSEIVQVDGSGLITATACVSQRISRLILEHRDKNEPSYLHISLLTFFPLHLPPFAIHSSPIPFHFLFFFLLSPFSNSPSLPPSILPFLPSFPFLFCLWTTTKVHLPTPSSG